MSRENGTKSLASEIHVLRKPRRLVSPPESVSLGGDLLKFSPRDVGYGSFSDWSGVCPPNSYVIVHPSGLPGTLPDALTEKFHRVVVMHSSSNETSFIVANGLRVDAKDNAIDQEPFAAGFDHANQVASGGFLHHGTWADRTYRPDASFFTAVQASGIQAHYPLAILPTAESGHLSTLQPPTHTQAFWEAVNALKR